ncbi:MAG: type I-E CRISPR-associated endoribonuclease Cas2 [Chthonomonadales bacterium]|nr:type I-E CRISPR-associated endoribonuclease Cas2 [Chthonomonadales bacterium]
MVVLLLERVPSSLRGELSRWMIEPRAGVFVGKLSAMVRERLWRKALEGARGGAGALIYTAACEQGFLVETFGDSAREVVDIEGMLLVRIRSDPGPHELDEGHDTATC